MTLPSLLPLVCRMLQLTCFGDRVFYQDWWNAATIGAYWRTWWVGVLAPICLSRRSGLPGQLSYLLLG